MSSCQTVKSVEEEINRANAFVSRDTSLRLEEEETFLTSANHDSPTLSIETGSEGPHLLYVGRELRGQGGLDRGPGEGND